MRVGLWRELARSSRYGCSGRGPDHHPVPHAAHYADTPPGSVAPLLGGGDPAASRCSPLSTAAALSSPPAPDCRRSVTCGLPGATRHRGPTRGPGACPACGAAPPHPPARWVDQYERHARGTSLSRWEAARREALHRLAPLRQGDVATVILMGTRPVTLTATDDASLIALRERLALVAQPGGRADLDAALALAGDLFLPNLDREVVVISDGAVTADPAVAAGVDAPVTLVIAGAAEGDEERANLAVIDISARPSPSGDGTVGLYTSIANFGPRSVTVPVSLQGDGLEIGRSDVTIAGEGAVEPLRWLLPPGVAELTVRIENADTLVADNTASLLPGETATTTIAPRILLVSDLPGALSRALMAIENVQLTVEPSDNLAAIAAGGYDLVVFYNGAASTETLSKIDTASLWVGPPVGGPFPTAEGIADPKVTRVRAGDPLLEGVDLSGATFGPTPIFTLSAGDEEIVGSADGPLLFRTKVNDQPAVVLTVDPETSNLPKRVAFPVLIANMVAALAPDGIPAAIPLGEPLVYEPRASTASVEIVPPSGEPAQLPVFSSETKDEGETSTDPVSRDIVYTDTGAAGVYIVTETDAAGIDLGI